MPKATDRISMVAVRGFKSICRETELAVRPLTILAGANSSGKSSFLQPLLLLKQTIESPGDPGALLLDGPNVRFTRTDQVLSHLQGEDGCAEFAVRVALLGGQCLEIVFRRQAGQGFSVARMLYRTGESAVSIHPAMTHEEILEVLPPHLKTMHKELEKGGSKPLRWGVRQERSFLTFGLTSTGELKARMQFGPYGVSPSHLFLPHIQSIIHLPGLRGNPQRTYPKTAGGPEFPGTFEAYVASVIAQWQANGSRKHLADLTAALEDMGLTWKVKAAPVDDTQVELKVGRLPHPRRGGAHDLVNIADVGFGVSQSLPVIVALVAARPGQLVYLEQPEIHLHPLAQRKLAEVVLAAVNRGVVAVLETHSVLLLREVQTMIARGKLDRESVAMHWFHRAEDGSTTVRTAELDDDGAYGDWPEDFDTTELEAENAYLDAVEVRRAKG